MQNKYEFKVGDLVERYKGGPNAGKQIYEPFVISRIVSGFRILFDDNGRGHYYENLRLVTSKSEINNDYNIF